MNQSGNVLFLILIAVALFAALSYAVTQSTRSGGGSTSNETSAINAAAMIQYPVGVRTAVIRMVIGGVDADDLEFNPPQDFGDCTSPEVCVFHPDGGGGTYVVAPTEITQRGINAGLTNPGWIYTSNIAVQNIGTTDPELIALIAGLSESVCRKINQELGLGDTIELPSPLDITDFAFHDPTINTEIYQDNDYDVNDQGLGIIFLSSPSHQGCYEGFGQAGRDFYYYHVLLER